MYTAMYISAFSFLFVIRCREALRLARPSISLNISGSMASQRKEKMKNDVLYAHTDMQQPGQIPSYCIYTNKLVAHERIQLKKKVK